MFPKPQRGLFVTGTSTESGKTFVASLIARSMSAAGHRVGVYKPAASDCVRVGDQIISEDAVALWEAAGRPLDLESVCPQRFQPVLAPPLSAKAEGREIDSILLRQGISAWCDACDVMVVEGFGGLMSPINDFEYIADLAADFGYPLIVVVPNVLGAINYTMQTLIAAACFREGLHVAGIVMTDPEGFSGDPSSSSNRAEIERRAVPAVLAQVGFGADRFEPEIDWFALVEQESLTAQHGKPHGLDQLRPVR